MSRICCLALLFLTAAAAGAENAADEQALIDLVRSGPAALNSDFEAWQSGYDSSWSYWRLGAEQTRARDPHMALVRANIEDGMRIDDFDVQIVEVLVEGDWGFVRYNATEKLTLATGEQRTVRFSSASLYTRESGNWKVLRSSLSYLPDEESGP